MSVLVRKEVRSGGIGGGWGKEVESKERMATIYMWLIKAGPFWMGGMGRRGRSVAVG